MSSRRSDILPYSLEPPVRAWRSTLLVNVPTIILISLMYPLGRVLEASIDPYFMRIGMLIGFNIILAVSLQLINGFSGQFSLGHAGFMAVGAYLAAFPALRYSNRFDDPGATLLFYIALAISVGIGAALLWALVYAIRLSRKLHRTLPGILLVVLVAWIVWDFSNAADSKQTPIWAVWSHASFLLQRLFAAINIGIGPAASRVFKVLPESARSPLCFIILVVGSGACASAVGFIVGLPALRLRGDYLAIATLGFGEIIRIGIQNSEPLGGALGLTGIPKFTNFGWLYAFVIVTIGVIWRVAYSPKGRAIMAVREDEIAASSIGVKTTDYKVIAFTIGAFFAGVAGALFSLHERSITPSYFNVVKSIEPVVMVTLGGLGSISGAILAAVVLTVLPELLRDISPQDRMVFYSLLLVVMMLLRPQGLLGGRELWPRRKRYSTGNIAPAEPEAVPA
jgi:branched-chain amino acid transport system permease protein